MQRQNVKVSVCCFNAIGPNGAELEKMGVPIFLIEKCPGVDFALIAKLRRHFISNKIDVVHTHGINPFFYGILAAVISGTPLKIQTDHARGIFPVSRKQMYTEMVLSLLADRVVAVSEGVRKDLIRYAHMAHSKVMTIYNGIDSDKFKRKLNVIEKKHQLGIKCGQIVFGVGVRLSEQKGIKYLIHAMSIVKNKSPDVILLIIGDGELRDELEKLTYDLGVVKSVRFLGFRNDIEELLSVLDVYVLPSLWEGHPLVLLEAMASELPVIATDISGNRETVAHGLTGFLVPEKKPEIFAEYIIQLAGDEGLRKRMGKQALRKFEGAYTLEKMGERYIKLYRDLLTQNG
jgi:glycosyltransferase involved in cell wall biosynthesis